VAGRSFCLQVARSASRLCSRRYTDVRVGIGANTAIFSIVNAALVQPLPYKNSDQLGFVWGDLTASGYPRGPLSGPELADLRRYCTLFSAFAGIWQNSLVVTGEGDPAQLRIGWVTSNFFTTLGVNPAIGRTFEATDEGQNAAPSIVLSWAVWQDRYGGDPGVVGRNIMVWGQPTRVIGVMPADFRLLFPPEASVPEDLEAWIPFSDDLARRPQRQNFLRVVARMKPGVRISQAHDEVSQIAARIFSERAAYAGTGRKLNLVGLQSEGTREIRPALIALMGGCRSVAADRVFERRGSAHCTGRCEDQGNGAAAGDRRESSADPEAMFD
jgi:hypothetical protein